MENSKNSAIVRVWHINLVKGNQEEYHRQPRLFFSFLDTFYYIKRHDDSLLK